MDTHHFTYGTTRSRDKEDILGGEGVIKLVYKHKLLLCILKAHLGYCRLFNEFIIKYVQHK